MFKKYIIDKSLRKIDISFLGTLTAEGGIMRKRYAILELLYSGFLYSYKAKNFTSASFPTFLNICTRDPVFDELTVSSIVRNI